MEDFDELTSGNKLIIDFLQESRKGIFSTKDSSGKENESDVSVKFINKKPIPSIEITFTYDSEFYDHHLPNLQRISTLPRKMKENFFSLRVINPKRGAVIIGGVPQIFGKRISIIVYEAEFISAKSGRKFPPYRFFEKIDP